MTQNAMKVMGIAEDDMNSIWRVISASLLFGNMEFKQERNSDQATLPDNTVAQKVMFLFEFTQASVPCLRLTQPTFRWLTC